MISNPAAYYSILGNQACPSPTSYSYYLFKFDLSSIPAGSTIVKAQLRLYAGNGNTGATCGRITTHDWTQALATRAGWNNPTSPALTWGPSSNAIFGTADMVTMTSFESVPAGAAYSVKDVTADVQGYVSGTFSNYGWGMTPGNHGYIFSEADVPTYDPGQRPALFVAYH